MFNGARVKELRKAKGLTQEKLANMINVTKVSICCYEKGTRVPNIETFCDLVNCLETTPNYLLGMDVSVVAEDTEEYSVLIQKGELEFIMESRKYPKVNKKIVEDPKRIINHLNSRL